MSSPFPPFSLNIPGIVPMLCEDLFRGIEGKKGQGISFEVKFSMLEIYNEVARDLLDAKGGSKKGGLKIRQHPKRGFYGKDQIIRDANNIYITIMARKK